MVSCARSSAEMGEMGELPKSRRKKRARVFVRVGRGRISRSADRMRPRIVKRRFAEWSARDDRTADLVGADLMHLGMELLNLFDTERMGVMLALPNP